MNNGKLSFDFGSETSASPYHLLMHHLIQLCFEKYPQLELKSTFLNLYFGQTRQTFTDNLVNSDFCILVPRETKTFLGEIENLAKKTDMPDFVPNYSPVILLVTLQLVPEKGFHVNFFRKIDKTRC